MLKLSLLHVPSGSTPLSSTQGGSRSTGGRGHRVTSAHVCSACHVFAGFYPSTDVCMFLINQGRREGEFVQRDKICRQNVWEAGHKKQAVMLSTNSHEQP